MRAIVTLLVGAALLGWAAPARADKWHRAAAIFDARCASCHSLEAPRPSPPPRVVDLSKALDGKSAEQLRAWLRAPLQITPASECRADLDGADVDAMLTLLLRKRHFVTDKKARPPAREQRR